MIILVTVYLLLSTVIDIYKQQISYILTGIALMAGTLILLSESRELYTNLIGAFTMFGVYIILALFFNGGGGDAVVMTLLGWLLGIYIATKIALIASLIYGLSVCAYKGFTKKPFKDIQLPFVPSVMLSFVIYSLIQII